MTNEVGADQLKGVQAQGRKYRVLHCVPSLHLGGQARRVLRTIPYFDAQRFEAFVCYVRPDNSLEPQYRQAGIDPICLGHQGKLGCLRTQMRLIKLVRSLGIDVIHTNGVLDSIFARFAGLVCQVPVVTSLVVSTIPEANGNIHLTRSLNVTNFDVWSGRFLTKRFIAVSQSVQQVYGQHYRIPDDRISVVYTGVSVADFAAPSDPNVLDRLAEGLDISGAYPVLVNVGRLYGMKGQRYMVSMMPEVLRKWPNAKLLIIGEGVRREDLEREIHDLGLENSVRLPGERSDVGDLLALSHVFVFPSIHSEGMPNALLEAMAAGKPVVAASTGPVAEVVEDGASGYLVEPRNPEALANGVLQVLESPDRMRRMGERGQQIINDKFNVQTSVRALEEVYLSVLERN